MDSSGLIRYCIVIRTHNGQFIIEYYKIFRILFTTNKSEFYYYSRCASRNDIYPPDVFNI